LNLFMASLSFLSLSFNFMATSRDYSIRFFRSSNELIWTVNKSSGRGLFWIEFIHFWICGLHYTFWSSMSRDCTSWGMPFYMNFLSSGVCSVEYLLYKCATKWLSWELGVTASFMFLSTWVNSFSGGAYVILTVCCGCWVDGCPNSPPCAGWLNREGCCCDGCWVNSEPPPPKRLLPLLG
jgi:hypothetical protein